MLTIVKLKTSSDDEKGGDDHNLGTACPGEGCSTGHPLNDRDNRPSKHEGSRDDGNENEDCGGEYEEGSGEDKLGQPKHKGTDENCGVDVRIGNNEHRKGDEHSLTTPWHKDTVKFEEMRQTNAAPVT